MSPRSRAHFIDSSYQTWNDTVTFDAKGTTTVGTDATSYFSTHYTSRVHRVWDTTTTAPDASGSKMDTDTRSYDQASTTVTTVSNLESNLPTGTVVFDENGYPTFQFDSPPNGTTFLSRSFVTSASDGTSTKTTSESTDPATPSWARDVETNHYSGDSATGLFVDSTATLGTGTASTDDIQLKIDFQQTTSTGGGGESDLTYVPTSGKIGWETTNSRNSVNTLADESTLRDIYTRDDGLTKGKRTTTWASSGSSSRTDSTRTEYDGERMGAAAVFTVKYKNADQGSSKSSSTDVGKTFSLVYDDYGLLFGMLSTSYDTSAQESSSGNSTFAGTDDRIANTGTMDNVIDSTSSASSKTFVSPYFVDTDGSTDDTKILISATSNRTSKATAKGNYDDTGAQIDGTSTSTVDANSSSNSESFTRLTPTSLPVKTILVIGSGTKGSKRTSDLTYNSDGSSNGTLTSKSKTDVAEDRKVWVKGVQVLKGGATTFDDFDRRNTRTIREQNADLNICADVPTGKTTSAVAMKVVKNGIIHHETDYSGDIFHAKLDSESHATLTTNDIVTSSIDFGVASVGRAFTYTEDSYSSGAQTANGKLSDGAGHTGTWTYSGSGETNVANWLFVRSTMSDDKWVESKRYFEINRTKSGQTKFHQEDNGIGVPAMPGYTEKRVHVKDITTSMRDDEYRSPETGPYSSFSWNRQNNSNVKETSTASYSNSTGKITGETSSVTSNASKLRDIQQGYTNLGGETKTLIDLQKYESNWSKSKGSHDSPSSLLEYDRGTSSYFNEVYYGTSASGTGSRSQNSGSKNWSRLGHP